MKGATLTRFSSSSHPGNGGARLRLCWHGSRRRVCAHQPTHTQCQNERSATNRQKSWPLVPSNVSAMIDADAPATTTPAAFFEYAAGSPIFSVDLREFAFTSWASETQETEVLGDVQSTISRILTASPTVDSLKTDGGAGGPSARNRIEGSRYSFAL